MEKKKLNGQADWWSGENRIIALFVLLKLAIHFAVNTNYGLHRDEYLYFAEGQHLGWGYMEGPPMIALLAWLADVFGSNIFVLRLLPTLAGAISIILIGRMTRILNGGPKAVFFVCLAFLISPQFLGSNVLFQPVSFNQMFWLSTMYLVLCLILYKDHRYWIYLGVVVGLGLMTKYSIVFLLLPLLFFSVLLPSTRFWYRTKHPYLAFLLAFLIFLPNLVWQAQHDFPVVVHMTALASSQLVNVGVFDFIRDQFLNHLSSSLIWFTGLIFLLRNRELKAYRLIAWTYFGLIIILILLSGKSYYGTGIYSSLFVFGGLAIEKYVRSSLQSGLIGGIMIILNLSALPYALPLLSIPQLERYCAFMDEHLGLSAPIVWEDGIKYTIPQDFADMRGWKDMVERVGAIYHSLSAAEKARCSIWGGSYGHAGAINFYRDQYDLPEAHSLSASFMIWCPSENDFDIQIVIDDQFQTHSTQFGDLQFIDSSEVRLARDPGYIFLKRNPIVPIPETWKRIIGDEKSRFNF